jgi:2-oxoglutarate ferredoxin oxidoreductase subunit beta
MSAGAVFVARTGTYYVKQMENLVKKAIEKKGFSLVEIICQCPTSYGRANRLGNAVDMLMWQKENCVPLKKYERLSEEEREGKIPIGIFKDVTKPDFVEIYRNVIRKARGEQQ